MVCATISLTFKSSKKWDLIKPRPTTALGNSQAVISEDVIQDKQANKTGESNQGKKHHSVELTSQKKSTGKSWAL